MSVQQGPLRENVHPITEHFTGQEVFIGQCCRSRIFFFLSEFAFLAYLPLNLASN